MQGDFRRQDESPKKDVNSANCRQEKDNVLLSNDGDHSLEMFDMFGRHTKERNTHVRRMPEI